MLYFPTYSETRKEKNITIEKKTGAQYVPISFSAVQIYDLSYIYLHPSHSTVILRAQKKRPAPSDSIAQSVEHCTGIAEVMSSNSVQD